eukprot:Phypoly_transcript_06746.p1 GENE.Phypoly_transcript_06746~~Phypoly_transcript_06746.p1  ORF type:complete len:441 (+),score=83.84 Phypoly_transcript_06746:99-1421(+)
MEDETKIEFLLEVFPTLSKQDIVARLSSAPPSERSSDALVAFFLAQEEQKADAKANGVVKIKEEHEFEENSIGKHCIKQENDPKEEHNSKRENIHNKPHDKDENIRFQENGQAKTEPRKSKFVIRDDGDESIEVSTDPVEYSALTGRIEKTADQLKQEDDDMKLAQKLYEEELMQFSHPQPQPYQSAYILPYHIPPPQKVTLIKSNNTTKTHTTTTTTKTNGNALPPNKRQAVGKDSETIKKSSADIAAQLHEIRKQHESQWKASGGKTQPYGGNRQSGMGFNAGYYNQLKEVREKHNREWHNDKASQKRVWTMGDMENATRQAHIDSGKFNVGDSLTVQIGKEALELTNRFRKENKLPPLMWHSALCTIGAQHSKNMAEHKVAFGHDGFQERIRQYPMPHRSAAENVAMSKGISDVANTAVHGWINSTGHRKNLLSHSE